MTPSYLSGDPWRTGARRGHNPAGSIPAASTSSIPSFPRVLSPVASEKCRSGAVDNPPIPQDRLYRWSAGPGTRR